MKDALGNEITIGGACGYSRNKSGLNMVKLGVVVEEKKTGLVALKIDKSFVSFYNEQPALESHQLNQKINVKPFMLFPIQVKQQLDYYKKRSELIDKYIKSGEIGDFEELKKM